MDGPASQGRRPRPRPRSITRGCGKHQTRSRSGIGLGPVHRRPAGEPLGSRARRRSRLLVRTRCVAGSRARRVVGTDLGPRILFFGDRGGCPFPLPDDDEPSGRANRLLHLGPDVRVVHGERARVGPNGFVLAEGDRDQARAIRTSAFTDHPKVVPGVGWASVLDPLVDLAGNRLIAGYPCFTLAHRGPGGTRSLLLLLLGHLTGCLADDVLHRALALLHRALGFEAPVLRDPADL